MPHRGRLNVLANVLNKPVELILNEFQSNLEGYDEVMTGAGITKPHAVAHMSCRVTHVMLYHAIHPP